MATYSISPTTSINPTSPINPTTSINPTSPINPTTSPSSVPEVPRCVHVMKQGPNRGKVCGRRTKAEGDDPTPVCFHHTEQRMSGQAKRQYDVYHAKSETPRSCPHVMIHGPRVGEQCGSRPDFGDPRVEPYCPVHAPWNKNRVGLKRRRNP